MMGHEPRLTDAAYAELADRYGWAGPTTFRPIDPLRGGPSLGILVGQEGEPSLLARASLGEDGRWAVAIEGPVSEATFTLGGRIVGPRSLRERLTRIAHVRGYLLEQTAWDAWSISAGMDRAGDERGVRGALWDALQDLYGGKGRFDVQIVEGIGPGHGSSRVVFEAGLAALARL